MLSKAKLAEIRALHQKKQREQSRLFIAEGLKTVLEILREKPHIIAEVFALPEFIQSQGRLLSELNTTVYEVRPSELQRISLQESPNQVMAICTMQSSEDLRYDFNKQFSLYLDDIRDPGNFGTLLRIASWFGIKKVFCSPECCELYNPKAIQASMGAFLRVEVIYCKLQDLITENRISFIYGAVLKGNNLYREKLGPGLILIGNEARGISTEHLQSVNKPITIPAAAGNGTESLNAAVAAGIICSEFFRQLFQS